MNDKQFKSHMSHIYAAIDSSVQQLLERGWTKQFCGRWEDPITLNHEPFINAVRISSERLNPKYAKTRTKRKQRTNPKTRRQS